MLWHADLESNEQTEHNRSAMLERIQKMRMHSEMETQGGIHQEEGSWLPRGNRKADRLSRGESHEAGSVRTRRPEAVWKLSGSCLEAV